MAALTCSGNERQITKISCTPANARLSNVQSSNVALHTGRRHCAIRALLQRVRCWTEFNTNPRLAHRERSETLVEAVGEDDRLQNLFIAAQVLLLSCR